MEHPRALKKKRGSVLFTIQLLSLPMAEESTKILIKHFLITCTEMYLNFLAYLRIFLRLEVN